MARAQVIILSDDDRRGASRRPLGAPATLRDTARTPLDAQLVDMSETGCLIRMDGNLAIGTGISVGVVGLPVTEATIVRRSGQVYGCAFVRPLPIGSVSGAGLGSNVVSGAFPAPLTMADMDQPTPSAVRGVTKAARRTAHWAAFIAITPLAITWIAGRALYLGITRRAPDPARDD